MSSITLERTGYAATAARPTVGAEAFPRVLTSALVGVGVCASLAPSLLPRSALTQAVVTAVFAAVALATSVVAHRVGSWIGRRLGTDGLPTVRRARITALGLSAGSVAAATLVAAGWQNTLRAAMDTDTVGLGHWAEIAAVASALFFLLYLLGAGVSALVHRIGFLRSLALALVAVAGIRFLAAPALWDSMATRFATSDAAVDPALTPPSSPHRSGSSESRTPWSTLGSEGREFVTAGADSTSVRIYVGLKSAPSLDERTALAVREMDRADAFSRAAVVVAIPTGSGWIDENAVGGIESRFGGDVATVGLQYSAQPSWATFLFAQTDARAAAAALLRAVASHIGEMDPNARPALYTYGQSLGSVGGSAAYVDERQDVCGALWAGPPAGAVDTRGAIVLANSSDPVVRWSTDLIVTPPDLSTTRADAPSPPWIPVIGFIQTTVDMMSALDAPPGHGHRYGADQGTALPDCRS